MKHVGVLVWSRLTPHSRFNFEDPRWKLPPDVVAFLDAHGEDRDSETKTPSSTPPLAPGRRKVTVGADGWETWQDGTDGSDDEDMPKDELKGIPAAPAPTRTNRKRARSRDSSASTAHATAVVAPRATSDGSVDQAFAGHCFCLTGTLSMVRDQWQEEIRNHGGTTAKTVTRNVRDMCTAVIWKGGDRCFVPGDGACSFGHGWKIHQQAPESRTTGCAPPPPTRARA